MSLKKSDKSKDNIRVFVSYAKEDTGMARKLIGHLSQTPNFQVFTTNRISAGEDWQSKIKKELSKSDFFVVLLSPTSLHSKWIQFELGAAWGLNKSIIPVVTSRDLINHLPLQFGDLQVIDLNEFTKKPGYIDQLIESHEKTAA